MNETRLVFRVTDDGTLAVFDQAGAKLRAVGTDAQRAGQQGERALTGLSRGAAIATAAIAAAGTAAVVFARQAGEILRQQDEVNKLAQSIGIATRELSGYSVVAALGNVSLQEFGRSAAILSRNLAEAQDRTSEAGRVMAALGIEVTTSTGALRSIDSVLIDLADRFSRLPDGPEKTAAAMRVLGRSGAQMIPILNQGADAIREQMAEAEALGATFDERAGAASERFNDNLTRLGLAATGTTRSLVNELLPGLVAVSDELVRGATAGVGYGGMLSGIAKQASNLLAFFAGISSGALGDISAAPPAPVGAESLGPVSVAPEGLQSRLGAALAGSGARATRGASAGARRAGVRAADPAREAARQLAAEQRAVVDIIGAELTLRENAVRRQQEQLRLAQRTGASAAEQLTIAHRLDAAEGERLRTLREQLETQLMQIDLPPTPDQAGEAARLSAELQIVNEQLAEAPQHAANLTAELQRARAVNLQDTFRSAITALQASGGTIDAASLLRGVLQIDGADLLAKSLGGLADRFGIGGDSLVEMIGNGIQQGFRGIASLFSGATSPAVSSVGAGADATTATTAGAGGAAAGIGGAGAASMYAAIALAAIGGIQGAFEAAKAERKRFGATDDSASGAALGGWLEGAFGAVGLEGVGGLIGSGARGLPREAALANAWMLGPIEGLLVTLLGQAPTRGTQVKRALNDLYNDARLPRQRVSLRGGRGGVQTQGIESAPDQAALDRLAALGYGGGGLIFGGSATDIRLRDELGLTPEEIAARTGNGAGFRLQQEVLAGAARNPVVAEMRFGESLAIGQALARTPRDAANLTNAITNNFLLMGTAANEARRQLLKMATTAGLDLIGTLGELNIAFQRSKKTADDVTRLTSAATGAVDLFNDLSAWLPAQQILNRNIDPTSGINVAGYQAGVRGYQTALDLEQQVRDARRSQMTIRQQESDLRRRLDEIDRRLQDTGLTDEQRRMLLQERADVGFAMASTAEQRFSPGAARRRATEAGYRVVDETIAQLKELGTAQGDNTTALNENTQALKAVGKAIGKGGGGKMELEVRVTGDGTEAASVSAIAAEMQRVIDRYVASPAFRAAVRAQMGNV